MTLLYPGETDFDAACDQVERYDDHDISFTEHMSGVLATNRDIDHIFAFDSDFRTLGFTLVLRIPVTLDIHILSRQKFRRLRRREH